MSRPGRNVVAPSSVEKCSYQREQRLAPSGHVFLLLKIRGANGQQVEALYEMVWESGAWKINSVVARPDPGEEA